MQNELRRKKESIIQGHRTDVISGNRPFDIGNLHEGVLFGVDESHRHYPSVKQNLFEQPAALR